jgi:hypothetical protein
MHAMRLRIVAHLYGELKRLINQRPRRASLFHAVEAVAVEPA